MGIGQTSAARAQPEFVLLDFVRRPRPAVATGHKCDRCGPQSSPELSVVWVRVPGTIVEAEMRLCLPCIKTYLQENALVTALQHQVAELQKVIVPRAQLLDAEAIIEKQRDIARQKLADELRAAKKKLRFLRSAARDTHEVAAREAAVTALEKEKQQRKDARKALAIELRAAKKKLSSLSGAIREAEEEASRQVTAYTKELRKSLTVNLVSARARLSALRAAHREYSEAWARQIIDQSDLGAAYPVVPPGVFAPTADGRGLPDASGIYFLWDGDVVEYVGQSIKLCGRLRLGNHHILKAKHKISFVFVPTRDLSWAECWYIGHLRPQLNFGSLGRHYVETPSGEAT